MLLITAPPKPHFSILHFYAFLACFVIGSLLLSGVIGTPPSIARLLRESSARPPSEPRTHAGVAPRDFRYPPLRTGRIMLLGSLAILNLALGGVVLRAFRSAPLLERILVPLPLLLFGIWLPVYLILYARFTIQVDEQGLRTRSRAGPVEIPWDDIRLLTRQDFWFGGAWLWKVYRVYARREAIVLRDPGRGERLVPPP